MNKYVKAMLYLTGVIGGGIIGYKYQQNQRALSLFDPETIAYNFQHMDQVMPSFDVAPAMVPFYFAKKTKSLPTTYSFKGETKSVEALLERTQTTGFLIIQDQTIIREDYFQGAHQATTFTSWSIAKSILSLLVGKAVEQGLIKDINEPITTYVPLLKKSGYHNVSIKHILQMASGVKFDETYEKRTSDIQKLFIKTLALNEGVDDVMAALQSKQSPGTAFDYNSSDTQALGMLIAHVTGKQPSRYFQDEIWSKIGTTDRAFWLTDRQGQDYAFCGFNATLRDYAKLGQLCLQKGHWDGKQVVSEEWLYESTRVHEESFPTMNKAFGYGYQWWVPFNDNKDILALGVWGQYLYIHPETKTIIVKTSGDPDFVEHEEETITMMRSLALHM